MNQVMGIIHFALFITAVQASVDPRCPPPSGNATICIITSASCFPTRPCPEGLVCCPEGCGSICKPPVVSDSIKFPSITVCPQVCQIFCPNGNVLDENGCPTCQCKECPKLSCAPICQYGFKRDKNGCEICECKESPTPSSVGCPTPPSRFLVRCSSGNDQCNSNYDCISGQICCNNPCGRYCTDPVPIKDGFCPKQADPSLVDCASFRDSCYLDGQCPDFTKCCSTACGNFCQNPMSKPAENPGVCKYVPAFPQCSTFQNKRKCNADFECPFYEKCCDSGCGKFCSESEPLVVNPGDCPKPKPDFNCVFYNRQCNQDGNCSPFLKCCADQCGTSCKQPQPKPGRCPNNIKCAVYDVCLNDQQCPGNELCCAAVGCGRTCVDPDIGASKPGTCPSPRDPAVVLCPVNSRNECTTDLDCRGDDKCCDDPCGKRCDLRPKPVCPNVCKIFCPNGNVLDENGCPTCQCKGRCPNNIKCAVYDVCLNDQQCPGNELCCAAVGCGRTCVDPDIGGSKPGTCPAPRDPAVVLCPVNSRNECTTDLDCRGDDKCCDDPCGKRCDLRPKPVCPNVCKIFCPNGNVLDENGCPTCQCKGRCPNNLKCAVYDLCLNDQQCPGNELCCAAVGCERTCVDPDIGASKPGTCPTPRDPAVVLCPVNSRNECTTDLDCRGDDKCCDDPCGNRCDLRPKPVCPNVCKIFCPNGNVLDENGCPTCQCKGECPNSIKCAVYDECLNDQQCRGNELCCAAVGCGRTCVDPDTGGSKPGTCPTPRNPAVVLCPVNSINQCTTDLDCRGDDKCCDDPCGKRCDLRPKPVCPNVCKIFCPNGNVLDENGCPTCQCKGRCPNNIKCAVYDECLNDQQCRGNELCCAAVGCGRKCVDPDTGGSKPGTCPTPRDPAVVLCQVNSRNQCTTDLDCRGDDKCCDDPCGKRCDLRPKPVCPNVCKIFCPNGNVLDENGCPTCQCKGRCPNNIKCAVYDVCLNDQQCPGNELCCAAVGCGRTCVDPDIGGSKPGTCPTPRDPAVVLCPVNSRNECTTDLDCRGDDKCCDDPCGKKCDLRPKPVCPNVCKIFCPNGNVLDENGCPTCQCKGRCPNNIKCSEFDECLNDQQCPGNELCCAAVGCGRTCVDPNTGGSKPGTCPAPRDPAVVLCPVNSRNECTTDLDCRGDDKCCDDPCGKRCDLRPKPVCPNVCKIFCPNGNVLDENGCPTCQCKGCPVVNVNPFLRPICAFPIIPPCNDDGDCSQGDICCPSICYNRCIKTTSPQTNKPGSPSDFEEPESESSESEESEES